MRPVMDIFDEGVTAVSNVVDALAADELGLRMRGAYQGAFERLQININTMADHLGSVIGKVMSTCGVLKSSQPKRASAATKRMREPAGSS